MAAEKQASLRLLPPNVGRDGVIDVPVVLGHLRSEPIHYALLSPDEALKFATELINTVRRARAQPMNNEGGK